MSHEALYDQVATLTKALEHIRTFEPQLVETAQAVHVKQDNG